MPYCLRYAAYAAYDALIRLFSLPIRRLLLRFGFSLPFFFRCVYRHTLY